MRGFYLEGDELHDRSIVIFRPAPQAFDDAPKLGTIEIWETSWVILAAG